MSGTASNVNPSTPRADSSTISTRLGYPLGTPQLPIDPPRRRSSLGFSQLFIWSTPTKHEGAHKDSNMADASHQRTPSNTSRKRMTPFTNTSTVTLGHVAQMQKRFQSAKASLRLDMAFAASPTGSIGSRLPPDKIPPSQSPAQVAQKDEEDLIKDWRYSLAPQLVAASEVDVREPVPEGSPTLPDMLYPEDEILTEPAEEPISSGFNSPMEATAIETLPETNGEINENEADNHDVQSTLALNACEAELAKTLKELRVCSDDEDVDMDLDESPIVSHLKRMSADTPSIVQLAESDDKEIFLSEPAEAAAESAKAKRSLLRRLFPRKGHLSSSGYDNHTESPGKKTPDNSPCPDPSLHKLMSMGGCPDPGAHWRVSPPSLSNSPMISLTPEAALTLARHTPSPMGGTLMPHALPFHRASSTESPMPFARPRTATPSPGPFYDPHESYYGPPFLPNSRAQRAFRPHTRNGYQGIASEHFQPGWYYAQESGQPSVRLNPMTYSFSTAAAKIIGQSAAPDSRIRDSYRTDTLTPLAKPPSRFRKTGIGALANTRGVSKYYDGSDRMKSRATRPGTSQSRRDKIQFRSSPPLDSESMASVHQRRRKSKELNNEQIDIHEDDTDEARTNRQGTRGEQGAEPIEIDENTRAAVRVSSNGPETVEALQGEHEGIRELTPNVTSWRKGIRLPRRKRRPSYWDGDLKEVRDSPAGKQDQVRSLQPGAERHVMTSPAKEDVESMRLSVKEDNADIEMENMDPWEDEHEESQGVLLIEGEAGEAVEEMEVELEV